MLSLLIRVDQVMSSWRVVAHLYDVNEAGDRVLLATCEDWLLEWPEDDAADSLTATVRTALRWSVQTLRNDSN